MAVSMNPLRLSGRSLESGIAAILAKRVLAGSMGNPAQEALRDIGLGVVEACGNQRVVELDQHENPPIGRWRRWHGRAARENTHEQRHARHTGPSNRGLPIAHAATIVTYPGLPGGGATPFSDDPRLSGNFAWARETAIDAERVKALS